MSIKNATATANIINTNSQGAASADPLRNMLEASRVEPRGLVLMVNGLHVPGLVMEVSDHFVIAKSQSLGNIVIRLDRIDGAAGFLSDAK
jgi:hypothetical protein